MNQQELAFKKARASPPLGCFGSRGKRGAHGAALRPSESRRAPGQLPASSRAARHSQAQAAALEHSCSTRGEPGNFGPPELMQRALTRCTNTQTLHSGNLWPWGFIACIGTFLHHQVTVPNINWNIYLYEAATDGRETVLHSLQGHLCLLGSTSAPGQNHFSWLTPLVSGVTRRENPRSSSALPQGQGSLALPCTKRSQGRGEGGCSNSTELRELSVTQGECTFFAFLNLASFRGRWTLH